ncbi:MAG: BF3164 family lipoprotein [Rikenellaceae bacterium]
MKKIILIILVSLNLLSCANGENKPTTIINLEGTEWDVSESLASVLGILPFNDYLLVHNINSETELTLFDTKSKSHLLNFGHTGRAYGEVFNSTNILVDKNFVSVYVSAKGAFVNFDLEDVKNIKISEKKVGDNTDRYVSMCKLTDLTYLASGIFPSEKRFLMFDDTSLSYIGDYPKNALIDESMPYNIEGSAYKSLLCSHPTQSKFVAANAYGKKLHIFKYNTSNREIDEVCVVGSKDPVFEIKKPGGYPNFKPTEKTIWGYRDVISDNNYIYALYSGRPQISRTPFLKSDLVEVYDWDGNLQCILKLDRDINRMTVVGNTIYAIVDMPEKGYNIVEYILPKL